MSERNGTGRRFTPMRQQRMLLLGLLLGPAALAAPQQAEAQPTSLVQEIEPFSSAGTVLTGNLTGFNGLPAAYMVGGEYDYSFTGPLLLDIGTYFGFNQELFLLRLSPGVKYKFLLPERSFVPYAKANLAADMSFGDGAGGNTLGIGLRLGGGVRHYFTRSFGMGAELGTTFGIAAGGDATTGTFALEALVAVEYMLP